MPRLLALASLLLCGCSAEPEARRELPQAMRELHLLEFDYGNGNGIDFEPYTEFLSPAETAEWLRAWTGNDSVNGAEYLVFGQDGTGGLAAFWLVRREVTVLEQPIVFFGSEGEARVVARDFASYLWLLASNVGPLEATEFLDIVRPQNAQFASFAYANAPEAEASASRIVEAARSEFPDFTDRVRALRN